MGGFTAEEIQESFIGKEEPTEPGLYQPMSLGVAHELLQSTDQSNPNHFLALKLHGDFHRCPVMHQSG